MKGRIRTRTFFEPDPAIELNCVRREKSRQRERKRVKDRNRPPATIDLLSVESSVDVLGGGLTLAVGLALREVCH